MMNNGRIVEDATIIEDNGHSSDEGKNESHFHLGCENQEVRKNKTCQGEG
jgi:hypothetical protein